MDKDDKDRTHVKIVLVVPVVLIVPVVLVVLVHYTFTINQCAKKAKKFYKGKNWANFFFAFFESESSNSNSHSLK